MSFAVACKLTVEAGFQERLTTQVCRALCCGADRSTGPHHIPVIPQSHMQNSFATCNGRRPQAEAGRIQRLLSQPPAQTNVRSRHQSLARTSTTLGARSTTIRAHAVDCKRIRFASTANAHTLDGFVLGFRPHLWRLHRARVTLLAPPPSRCHGAFQQNRPKKTCRLHE